MFNCLHSADKFSYEQQIFGLNKDDEDSDNSEKDEEKAAEKTKKLSEKVKTNKMDPDHRWGLRETTHRIKKSVFCIHGILSVFVIGGVSPPQVIVEKREAVAAEQKFCRGDGHGSALPPHRAQGRGSSCGQGSHQVKIKSDKPEGLLLIQKFIGKAANLGL